MEVVALKPEHLQAIDLQAIQAPMKPVVCDPAFYKMATADFPAYAIEHEGQVLACCGVQLLWENRGLCWALISKEAGPMMLSLTRMIKAYLVSVPIRRLEAYVRRDFKAGIQWMRLLGFEYEGHMHSFFENGEDANLYACIK